MSIRRSVGWLASLLCIGVGLTLIAVFFLGQNSGSTATNDPDLGGFNVPELGGAQESQYAAAGGPADKTLKITIPKMNQIENDTVPDTTGGDEQSLKENAAIHLKGTGFPWQQEANVYLAGHRLGYPATDSFLAFYDLNKLEKGDKAFVTDANGTKYTYEVFKEFIVGPDDVYVTEPVPGRNVLTLQTCTLPDYSKRLIVQAELIAVS
ncbi:MAG: class E sortase [Rubrobacteraceae bacterium]